MVIDKYWLMIMSKCEQNFDIKYVWVFQVAAFYDGIVE